MIITWDRLTAILAPFEIDPMYPDTGRFAFRHGDRVRRCCFFVDDDPSIRPELRPQCRQADSLEDVADQTAGFVGQYVTGPIYLVPQIHWEHELLDDHCGMWATIFDHLGQAPDDVALTGGNAVVADARLAAWADICRILLAGLQSSDVMLFCQMPLMVKIHHHGQVWFSSTNVDLLPPHISTNLG